MKIKHLMNNNGNKAMNHFTIQDNGAVYLQSYDVIVVKISGTDVFLDERYHNYSNTTTKHRNIFLKEDTKTINKKIKDGVYKLVNLNT